MNVIKLDTETELGAFRHWSDLAFYQYSNDPTGTTPKPDSEQAWLAAREKGMLEMLPLLALVQHLAHDTGVVNLRDDSTRCSACGTNVTLHEPHKSDCIVQNARAALEKHKCLTPFLDKVLPDESVVMQPIHLTSTLLSLDDFWQRQADGLDTPADGRGFWATDAGMSAAHPVNDTKPLWATHVAWFQNRIKVIP